MSQNRGQRRSRANHHIGRILTAIAQAFVERNDVRMLVLLLFFGKQASSRALCKR